MTGRQSEVDLTAPSASLLVESVEGHDWAWVTIKMAGRALMLGGNSAAAIRRNFLVGLDPTGPHRQMEASHRYVPLIGQHCFYFQGLASTSAIYAAYRPDGVLRLLVQGSQQDHELEVVIDLTPAVREAWARRVDAWLTPSSPYNRPSM